MGKRPFLELALLTFITISNNGLAADFYSDVEIGSFYTSNVYLNSLEEWDLAIAPKLGIGLDFQDYWSIGYHGGLDAFVKHRDLFFHKHELYFVANPTWGVEDENEMAARLSLKTQRNTETYSSINFVEPALDFLLAMEPVQWFRWSISQTFFYRLFYNDVASDSFDSWTSGSMTFTAPSRTTVSPRLAFGARFYPRQDTSVTDDTSDQQIEAGLHLSQGLWESGGLQADWAYLHSIGASGLIQQKLTDVEFSYIGEEFLFSGHQAELGFKQIFENGWSFGFGAKYEFRTYGGWWVLDENGDPTDVERQDQRLEPAGWLEYSWLPGEHASSAAPSFKTSLEYSYLRQWSNDEWYDTDRNLVELSFELGW
jgi:hypothetical protein